ncbi:MAG: PepSY-associated TM helix domain-containing protein [Dysgonamonadaceae bacterium]|nr:PepSY-associated TM helix domain-containing protein [Dysgonamonadaceae bacterium]
MRIVRWLRVIHRDLGFLVVGMSVVYGISGIYLNHLDGKDPAYRTEVGFVQLPPGLSGEKLSEVWKSDPRLPSLKKVIRIDESHFRLMLEGGVGVYSSLDGHTDYEKHTKRAFVYWINRLHYNKIKDWSPVADFFAVSLLFLAVSGIFLVKGRRGITGSGKWFLLAGLLIPLLYILLQ